MAYPPLGYPYSPTHQFLMPSNSLASCLEPGGRSLVDSLPAPSHPSLTCPVYENRVISSPGHELTPPAGIGVYSGAYQSQGYYSTCSRDVKALYSRGTLDSEALSAPAPAYYPYDYAFGQYSYDRYGYASPDAASRRKNTNRETTSTLKAWLQEHQKNPYPTKGEKIMLAIITKMTLTQVSTWFANARRRLKKENKVTWSQRANKGSDDRGLDDDSDGREESVEDQPMKSLAGADLKDLDLLESDASDGEQKHKFDSESVSIQIGSMQTAHPSNSFSQTTETFQRNRSLSTNTPKVPPEQNPPGIDSKPKTWSIAQTAVSLNSNIQPEYLSCMLSFTGASDMGRAVFHRTRDSPSDMGRAVSHRTQDSPSDMGRAVSHRTQDSPSDMGRAVSHRTQDSPSDMGRAVSHRTQDSSVAMLKEWVDGVFHDPPLFNPQPVNQTTVKQTTAWKWLNTFSMETQGHLFEHTLQHV